MLQHRLNTEQQQKQKVFNGNFSAGATILFSISDKDKNKRFSLDVEEPSEQGDEDFEQSSALTAQTLNVKEVIINITFLLSRWNILSDLIFCLNKIIVKNDEVLPKEILSANIEELKQLLAIRFVRDIAFLEILTTAAIDLYKFIIKCEGQSLKSIQKEIMSEFCKIASSFTPIINARTATWKQVNQKSIELIQRQKKGSIFEWGQFLSDTEFQATYDKVYSLYSNSNQLNTFYKKIHSVAQSRIHSRYAKIKGAIAKYLLLACKAYAIEESAFAVWGSTKSGLIRCEYEIHDGQLNPAMVEAHEKLGNKEILKFIEIVTLEKRTQDSSITPINTMVRPSTMPLMFGGTPVFTNQQTPMVCCLYQLPYQTGQYIPMQQLPLDRNELSYSFTNGTWQATCSIKFMECSFVANPFPTLQTIITQNKENALSDQREESDWQLHISKRSFKWEFSCTMYLYKKGNYYGTVNKAFAFMESSMKSMKEEREEALKISYIEALRHNGTFRRTALQHKYTSIQAVKIEEIILNKVQEFLTL